MAPPLRVPASKELLSPRNLSTKSLRKKDGPGVSFSFLDKLGSKVLPSSKEVFRKIKGPK